jgi:hypothetical protein
MPLFRGRPLSNQDVPDIERKHGSEKKTNKDKLNVCSEKLIGKIVIT